MIVNVKITKLNENGKDLVKNARKPKCRATFLRLPYKRQIMS